MVDIAAGATLQLDASETLAQLTGAGALLSVGCALTVLLVLCAVCVRWVEQPAIRRGRKLATRAVRSPRT